MRDRRAAEEPTTFEHSPAMVGLVVLGRAPWKPTAVDNERPYTVRWQVPQRRDAEQMSWQRVLSEDRAGRKWCNDRADGDHVHGSDA